MPKGKWSEPIWTTMSLVQIDPDSYLIDTIPFGLHHNSFLVELIISRYLASIGITFVSPSTLHKSGIIKIETLLMRWQD